MKKFSLYIVFISFLFACEETIDVDLKDAPPAYVVDAWINDKMETQVIRLTLTQPYFDAGEYESVTGANITVTSENKTFEFIETDPGYYEWNPVTSADRIETIGSRYQLNVNVDGEQFFAESELRRVPPVDSIKYTYKEERNQFQPEGYYGEFLATDPVGSGDTYWIKAYKNGELLNNPFDLNIAYDAGFNEGGNIDGVVFIQPIQDAVTPLNEDLDEIVPYVPGDSLHVEIHSVTHEAFAFLQQVQIQTQRDGGFDEIFAEPLENVSSNIIKQNTTSNVQVIGFFNVSAVSGRGRKLVE
ncbi:DUF4249 domain-containing protein [Fulvivirga lutea]|uniref:DUF4249 domain-containing protein n=1 Tax=Fulvivirga lutea TaxID=2810512 RepID=A0A975A0A7_9BACT|nr:DUF4249 domain-containing protein [Fulvivirga lutea]QSE97056.1 DUF4249 domain-containing protein [Fulvivirga lutea]